MKSTSTFDVPETPLIIRLKDTFVVPPITVLNGTPFSSSRSKSSPKVMALAYGVMRLETANTAPKVKVNNLPAFILAPFSLYVNEAFCG